jgi:hypothetical protein
MNMMNNDWSIVLAWITSLVALAAIVWLIIKVVNQKNIINQLNNKSPLEVLK